MILAAIVGIVLLAACLQGAVGFGFSLFALPLMLMCGIRVQDAVLLAVLMSLYQRIHMLAAMHAHIKWRQLALLMASAVVALPAGCLLLRLLALGDPGRTRQIVGFILLGALLLQWRARVKPAARLARGWDVAAGVGSGLMQGLANIGGPPIVMWLYAHDWTNEQLRIAPSSVTILLVPIQLVILFTLFDYAWMPLAGWVAGALPAAMAGTFAGLALGRRLPVPRLRRAAYTLLVLICISAIVTPLL